MKILEIVSGQSVNGALVHVDLLTRRLIERGHQVHLLCRHRSWIWRRLHRTGIPKRKSDMRRFPPDELWRLAHWVKSEKFDVIHTHMSRAHHFGILLRALTGVPCVATAHASNPHPHWRFNDLVICNSESTAWFQRWINLVPPKRSLTIPCFIDLEKFRWGEQRARMKIRSQLRIGAEQPLVGILGSVVERKGQLPFIASLPYLVQKFPQLKVLFIGEFDKTKRYYHKIRSSLFQKKLFRRVVWLGRRNNVQELLRAIDLLVVPSLSEPLGLCALEAMASGVPVVASDRGGLKEFVIPEQTGLLFDPLNSRQMAACIERGLTDTSWREHVIEQGQTMLDEKFSPLAITRQIEAALQSVVRTKNKEFLTNPIHPAKI